MQIYTDRPVAATQDRKMCVCVRVRVRACMCVGPYVLQISAAGGLLNHPKWVGKL